MQAFLGIVESFLPRLAIAQTGSSSTPDGLEFAGLVEVHVQSFNDVFALGHVGGLIDTLRMLDGSQVVIDQSSGQLLAHCPASVALAGPKNSSSDMWPRPEMAPKRTSTT
ncbi:hypothetical protein D3C87_1787980 [compost metagenome]